VARVGEISAIVTQGATQEEARGMVLSVVRE